jgi:acyl-CoA synthetase (NDP forming)
LAKSAEEAVKIADGIGYPVVMKIMSEDIVHKYDVEGVELNIRSQEEVEKVYEGIITRVKRNAPDARIEGIFVTHQIPRGEEVILGIKRDPVFGPVIMFGMGGIYVEVFEDVSFGVAPLDEKATEKMMERIKAYPLLKGFRGRKPRDLKVLKDTIMRLSQLAVDCPQIKELDINPLILLEEGQGAYVADAKLML